MKYLGSMMMLNGQQRRVIGKMSYADFMAMTGISRDFISETGNADDVAALDGVPAGTLLYYQNDRIPSSIRPVPDAHICYRSAKDKAATRKAQADAAAARRAEYAEKRVQEKDAMTAARADRIAALLYGFDRHNVAWADADTALRDLYLQRAVEVIAIY